MFMDEEVIAVLVIAAIVALIINGIIAMEFQFAATEKGYDEKKYFWYSFLFGALGGLIVIALPNKKQSTNTEANPSSFDKNELPDL